MSRRHQPWSLTEGETSGNFVGLEVEEPEMVRSYVECTCLFIDAGNVIISPFVKGIVQRILTGVNTMLK
jgi:hypothetical protein